MTREEISNYSLKLIEENKVIALEFATGVGKSKVGLDCVQSLYDKSSDPKKFKILLVVHELAHFKNWEDEFIKWEYEILKEQTIITTYASLKKYKSTTFDIVILDEAHHIGSDIRLDIIQDISFNKMILLSATLSELLKESLSIILKNKVNSFKISLQDAIDWDILRPVRIIAFGIHLQNNARNETIIETWGKANLRKKYKCSYNERWEYLKNKTTKYPHGHLEIKCTQAEKYADITNKFNYYKSQFFSRPSAMSKAKWLQYGSQRKRLLGEWKSKYVQEFLNSEELKNKRYICFCSSIEQADLLGGNNSIHSKKKESAQTILDFNNKKIDTLFAVGMLQEGQNLVDIDAGVIVQLDGVERAFIQKLGRSMRSKEPIQYIFYYKNSRDEEYLNNVLEDFDKEFIEYEDIN